MKRKFLSVLFALVLVVGFSLVTGVPAAADGSTYYVATTGSDDFGDGTETWVDTDNSTAWSSGDTGPWLTIAYGCSQASSGDSIIVSDGTYTEDLTVNTANLTLSSKNGAANTTIQLVDGVGIDIQGGASDFTLGGAAGHGFTILGNSENTTFNIQLVNAPSNVEISHNSIDTTGHASQGISVGAAGATGLTVSNNTFTAEDGDGSIWGPDVVNVSVSNNTFTGPSTPTSGYAVEFAGVTGTSGISGNTITNYANGVFTLGGGPAGGTTPVSGLTISGNTISGCYHSIRVGHSSQTSDVADVTVTENTINDFKKSGIWVQYVLSVQIQGNIISTTNVSEASNGIQVGYIGCALGTTGSVNDNQISGCHWSGYDALTETYEDDWTGSGILAIDTGSDNLTISGNEVQNCDVGLDIELGSSTITNNDVHDNSYGFALWNAYPTISYNNIYNNALYGVYRTSDGDLTGTLDAENNWWGNASGPSGTAAVLGYDIGYGDKVSDNVTYEPWLLEVVVTDVTPTTYEKTLALKDGWTLVSTNKEVTTGTTSVEPTLTYTYTPVVGYAEATAADLEPVSALYVKTSGGGGVGINYATGAPGVSSKDLAAGWNLISSATETDAGAVLSPLRYVAGEEAVALATLVSQGNYNQFTAAWYIDATTWTNVSGTMNPFDGYWVYMNAGKSFGVIPD